MPNSDNPAATGRLASLGRQWRAFDVLLAALLATVLIYASPIEFAYPGWPYRVLVLFPIYTLSFYFLCYVLLIPYWADHKKRVLLGIAFYYLVFTLYFMYVSSAKIESTKVTSDTVATLFAMTLYLYVLIVAGSVIYFGFLSSNRRQREQELQLAQQDRAIHDLNMEKLFQQKVFDAHRTRNFLSTLYSRVLNKAPSLADFVETYSDMLTYSMMIRVNQPVDLEQEVNYIKQFIVLEQQISGADPDCVSLEIVGSLEGRRLFPRLLITLVENAFHHGKTTGGDRPTIQIKLIVRDNELYFYVHNEKESRMDITSGVGKTNLKKTLDLHYPNRHELKVADNSTTYTCILILQLDD